MLEMGKNYQGDSGLKRWVDGGCGKWEELHA